MKKLHLSIIIPMLAIAASIISCQKEENTPPKPPPPVVQKYSLTVQIQGKGTVTPDAMSNISSGTNISVVYTADPGYVIAEIKINAVPLSQLPKGSKSFTSNLTIDANKIVTVAFITEDLYLLTTLPNQKPWKQVSNKCYKAEDNSYLCSFSLDEEQKQLEYTYVYPEMKEYLVNPMKGTTSNMPFILSNNLLKLDVTDYWITELTPSVLSYKTSSRIDPNLGNIYFIRTFNRQQ